MSWGLRLETTSWFVFPLQYTLGHPLRHFLVAGYCYLFIFSVITCFFNARENENSINHNYTITEPRFDMRIILLYMHLL